MPTDPDFARQEIRKLPGSDGWWHSDGEETYLRLLDELLGRGFHPDDALALLESAYGAAAAEFGS